MKRSKLIGLSLLAGAALGIYSCNNARMENISQDYERHNQQIVGTVLEETRSPSAYAVKVRVGKNRELALSIIDGSPSLYGNKKKEALDLLIEPGTQISFPQGYMWRKDFNWYLCEGSNPNYNLRENFVSENTNVVTRAADRVQILGNK